jgi:hypothetical protein
MATTTNYGWVTPDDTALVKDGAAAIRTLGTSVDTTTKNLNPSTTLGDIEYRSSTANVNTRLPLGTAGQVLKVNSGATAPEWATDATGMTNPMTTTGDTIYSSSGSTPARLGIGTAGQVLIVNAGATAPEWGSASASKSFSLLNSGGTALTGATTITVSGLTGDDIYILINGASSANASSNMRLRLNTDSTSKYSASGYGLTSTPALTTVIDGTPDSQTEITLTNLSNNAGSVMGAWVQIRGASSSGIKLITTGAGADAGGGSNHRQQSLQGTYTGTSAITSVSLISSTGNFDAGTIYVYGAN